MTGLLRTLPLIDAIGHRVAGLGGRKTVGNANMKNIVLAMAKSPCFHQFRAVGPDRRCRTIRDASHLHRNRRAIGNDIR